MFVSVVAGQVTRFEYAQVHCMRCENKAVYCTIYADLPAALPIGASPNLYARKMFAEWQTLS